MFKMLGAAVAAIALSFAGQASAAVTFDFEGGQVGQAYPWTSLDGVSFSGGTAVATSQGISLQLAETPDYESPSSSFDVYGWGKFYQGPRQFIWTPRVLSFDLYLPDGGMIDYLGYAWTRVTIQAGEWTTITYPFLNYSPDADCAWGCKFFIYGSGALVDNVVIERGSASIPEPATWAMMIVGFGAVGSMIRTSRRRNALSAV